jgi:hypothetical protein
VNRDALPEITTEGYAVFARFKQLLGEGLIAELVHNAKRAASGCELAS